MELIKSELEQACKKLKISSDLAETAMTIEAGTHQEFLLNLLGSMAASRNENRKTRYINRAHFPYKIDICDYNEKETEFMDDTTMESLRALEFLTGRQNLVIIGNAGTGKTKLSVGLGLTACKAGYKTAFFCVPELLKILGNREDYAKYGKAMRRMEEAHFIILDEFGYTSMTKQQSEDLFNFIAAASREKSVLINTIRELTEWEKLMPDPVLAAAFVSRCIDNCVLIHLTGKDMRALELLNKKKKKTRKSTDE